MLSLLRILCSHSRMEHLGHFVAFTPILLSAHAWPAPPPTDMSRIFPPKNICYLLLMSHPTTTHSGREVTTGE